MVSNAKAEVCVCVICFSTVNFQRICLCGLGWGSRSVTGMKKILQNHRPAQGIQIFASLPSPLSLTNIIIFLSRKHVQVWFKSTRGVKSDKVSSFFNEVFNNFPFLSLYNLPCVLNPAIAPKNYIKSGISGTSCWLKCTHMERNLMVLVDKSGCTRSDAKTWIHSVVRWFL